MTVLSLVPGPGYALAIASLLAVSYAVANVIYNLYFHPLASYPGPLLMRTSRIPYTLHLLAGRLPFQVLKLHKQYGEVVRIGPNELVFANARAWKDIMGHRGPGEVEMPKAPSVFRTLKNQPTTLINADREEHGRIRRQLAHGFSDKSMRAQEGIIRGYVDLFVQRLKEACEVDGGKVDMVKWYNYTTFDIIGDLAFGEPFGCLETGEYHPWVAMIFQSIKLGAYLAAANFFPWFRSLVMALTPKSLMEKREQHLKLTKEKLLKRIDLGAERPDLIEGLLKKREDQQEAMSLPQLQAHSSLLIIAGSETTATLLAGATYLLLKNPDALARLTNEVRTSFENEEDITFQSVSTLQYMLACLDEALRVYPPAPLGLPRIVPKGGHEVAGHFVPEDTVVSQYHYAVYHNGRFFALPDEFHPERWLGDPRFANDDRDIFQPFHVGPRNCIGRNLAYIEMRIILARLLWNFDLSLAEDSQDWIGKQKIFFLWEKVPLNVHLTPRFQV